MSFIFFYMHFRRLTTFSRNFKAETKFWKKKSAGTALGPLSAHGFKGTSWPI
jgi:hypothetical protein